MKNHKEERKQKLYSAWHQTGSAMRDSDWSRLCKASNKLHFASRMLELDEEQAKQEQLWIEQVDNSPIVRAIQTAITNIKRIVT